MYVFPVIFFFITQHLNMKMGVSLIESVGSTLGGVLSEANTFSNALASALKGCVHPVAICREVRPPELYFLIYYHIHY